MKFKRFFTESASDNHREKILSVLNAKLNHIRSTHGSEDEVERLTHKIAFLTSMHQDGAGHITVDDVYDDHNKVGDEYDAGYEAEDMYSEAKERKPKKPRPLSKTKQDKLDVENRFQDFDFSKIKGQASYEQINPQDLADPEVRELGKKNKSIVERQSKLLHNSTINAILDENGNGIDLEKLKNIFTGTPDKKLNLLGKNAKLSTSRGSLVGKNDKLTKSGDGEKVFFDLTLPAYQGLYYDEDLNSFQIIRTCPNAGMCKAYCYAAKGGFIQYSNSAEKSAKTMTFLMNHPKEFAHSIANNLKAKLRHHAYKGKQIMFRWHDSGDFFVPQYLEMAYEIARETPEVLHYAYTKMVGQVNSSNKPDNFIFNMSFGGKEDKKIDRASGEKHADVVLPDVTSDLNIYKVIKPGQEEKKDPAKKSVIDPKDLPTLKQRISDKWGYPISSLFTYDQMMKIPVGDAGIMNVLVFPGDGDDSATRTDVNGTLLVKH
jgi:hypothetical protein